MIQYIPQIPTKASIDNVFDGVITKNGTVSMAGGEYPCDLTQLFTSAKYNEDGVLVDNEGKEIEVAGTEVLVTVPVSAMSMSDDENAGGVCGHIISLIYKGDHYKYTVRTETEDDFTIDDEWLWNENDYVSIVIDPKDIKLQRKNKEEQ